MYADFKVTKGEYIEPYGWDAFGKPLKQGQNETDSVNVNPFLDASTAAGPPSIADIIKIATERDKDNNAPDESSGSQVSPAAESRNGGLKDLILPTSVKPSAGKTLIQEVSSTMSLEIPGKKMVPDYRVKEVGKVRTISVTLTGVVSCFRLLNYFFLD